MKKKSNSKLKKAVLKYTRYNPKWKYKIVFYETRTNITYYAKNLTNAKKRIKQLGSNLTATLYERRKNAKGFFQWRKIGKFNYSKQTGKVYRQRKLL
jgi:hypothetical protein